MTKNELKEIIARDDRYSDFKVLDAPVVFAEAFRNKPFDTVQIHQLIQHNGESFFTFVGVFSWNGSALAPLDGDIYTPNMRVLGYDDFSYTETVCGEEEPRLGLDILVTEW